MKRIQGRPRTVGFEVDPAWWTADFWGTLELSVDGSEDDGVSMSITVRDEGPGIPAGRLPDPPR